MGTISIDVIKMRQTQDRNGHVLMLRLNPADDTGVAAVSLTPCGAQFRMTLSDLDDSGNPPDAGSGVPAGETGTVQQQVLRNCSPVSRRLTRQAGACCNDPLFRKFLILHEMPARDKNEAAVAVRLICGCNSRREIVPGTPAGAKWDDLYSKFTAWRYAPEVAE